MTRNDKRLAILILTLNEEQNLPISLGSVRKELGDVPVLVLDSLSTDATAHVAKSFGACVETRKFDGYATQRNYGLDHLKDYDWVLMLDADEEITPEFSAELSTFVSVSPATTHMALFRRRDFFMGKWIRRSSGYPTWFGRVVRPLKVSVEREINEEYVCTGDKKYLEAHINHYPFSKGLDHWVDKHNRYSSSEALLLASSLNGDTRFLDILTKDKSIQRAAMKRLYMCLPFRPLWGFVYLYIIRLGILDGRAGFNFCTLRFIYECLINLKKGQLLTNSEGSCR